MSKKEIDVAPSDINSKTNSVTAPSKDVHAYNVLIDYADTWDDTDIKTFQTSIIASSAKEAYNLAQANLDKGVYIRDIPKEKVTYVWDVIEDDKID